MKTKYYCVVFLLLAGCWSAPSASSIVDRAVNKTVDSAADKVGERVGEAIAADILANNPDLMYAYSMSVFQMMFYQGGYYIEYGETYSEGQYTRFRTEGVTEGDWFEKVLLRQHDNGNQWWRVETRTKNDDGSTDVVIMESLFSQPDSSGTRRVLRMRAQLPGEEEPSEIPITERDSQRWRFYEHNRLTEESMEGMTKGVENVETPAGTFQAKHLQTTYGSDGLVDWWLVEKIPGGVVKYTRKYDAESEEPDHVVTLLEHGDGKTESMLGVDLSSGAKIAEDDGEAAEGEAEGDATDAEEDTTDEPAADETE